MKTLIIGGVAGGASAAARLRRLDENAEIVIVERTGFVSYANCGLPYYVGGVISDPRRLTLQTPKSLKVRYNIDVRVLSEVVSIDTGSKTVRIRDLQYGSEYDETYDNLIISTGSKVPVSDELNPDDPRVLTLRTVEDALAMREVARNARRVLVVGGGYIGLETAENLAHMGLDVTVVHRPGQIIQQFDSDVLERTIPLVEGSVDLRLKTAVTSIDAGENLIATLSDGSTVEADLVVLAAGSVPDTDVAEAAGIALGLKKAIYVDPRMMTSAPGVYAVGDAIQVRNGVTDEYSLLAFAGPANRQGRMVADNICGARNLYKGSFGSSVIKVFDSTVAMTGINSRTAAQHGFQTQVETIEAGSGTVLRVLMDSVDGKILGAQAEGPFDCDLCPADEMVDVVATVMQCGRPFDEIFQSIEQTSPAGFDVVLSEEESIALEDYIARADGSTVVVPGSVEGALHVAGQLMDGGFKVVLTVTEDGPVGGFDHEVWCESGPLDNDSLSVMAEGSEPQDLPKVVLREDLTFGRFFVTVNEFLGRKFISLGINEAEARRQGIPYDKVHTFSKSNASYYPGAADISIKTIFDPMSGNVLGAQLVGTKGVVKRAKVLHAAILGEATVENLAQLELCYAPPYNSAKDPVNYAGFVASNVRMGLVKQEFCNRLDSLLADPSVTVLDVRTDLEVGGYQLPGAKCIPLDSLRGRLDEIDPRKPVYVVCRSGLRSYIACRILSQNGFDCYNMAGGQRQYELLKNMQN